MYIWSSYLIIKGVKWYLKGLTFDLEYLTLGAKIRYSASLRFCVWSFCTYLCNLSLIGWEMREEFAKMRKNCQNWPVYRPGWPWPKGPTLRHMPGSYFFGGAYTDQVSRKSEYGKGVKMLWLTPERTNGQNGWLIYLRGPQIKMDNSPRFITVLDRSFLII